MRKTACIFLAAFLGLLAAAGAQETQQVNVSVKIIEFQSNRLYSTGLSAYFRQRAETRWGRVQLPTGAITEADLTFPRADTVGLTVFLDRISFNYGDIEMVLQALVDQGRAFILSRPQAMVMVGAAQPTVIETVQKVPFESTQVVGATAFQVTDFRETGVRLEVSALAVHNEDGDVDTTADNFIQLRINAKVDEEGSRVPVALDNRLSSDLGNLISVPQFSNRQITTTVWVPHGQVLILGGLFLNRKNKDLTTLPWLTQGQDFINGSIQRFTPFSTPAVPVTSALGRNQDERSRRELVFLIKADLWRASYTIADEFGFEEEEAEEEAEKKRPQDVIGDVLQGIGDIPQGIAEGISGGGDAEGLNLGGNGE